MILYISKFQIVVNEGAKVKLVLVVCNNQIINRWNYYYTALVHLIRFINESVHSTLAMLPSYERIQMKMDDDRRGN